MYDATMQMAVPKLAIGVFCTLINEKYMAQVRACRETWVQTAKRLGVPVYFFAGYAKSEEFPEIIQLEGCAEDIQSATTKQFRGLQWLVQNCPAESYMIFGSDTFPNIPNLLTMLSKYDLTLDLYVGGDGGHRQIGARNVYFHSGGSGFILTLSAAQKIAAITDEILNSWATICTVRGAGYLTVACDVTIAYFCENLGVKTVIESHFHGCNYLGKVGNHQCCTNVIADKICSCHYMMPEDMKTYHDLIST